MRALLTPRLALLLVAITVAAAANPVTAQEPRPSPIPESELLARLSNSLDSLSTLDQFSGVVVLAREGTPVFQRAYGMADRERGLPNTIETAFNLGSINKVFTATAIRQLAADGRLHLDSALAVYWPDYPNPDVARRITIRQLLAHRSGVGGDIFAAPPGGSRHDLRHNREFLQLFAARPLDFEPGSRQQYSNAGFVLLGMLVERLSGMDYYEYVQRHIYEPAGMRRTGHWRVDSLPENTAIGYRRDEASGTLARNTATLPGRGSAAGGGYSTAADLLRFLQAIRAGSIRGAPLAGIGAAGGAPGINAMLEGGLPGGYDLVVLANLDPPTAMRVARLVRGWLGDED